MTPAARLLSDRDGRITTVLACLPARLVEDEPSLAAALLAAPPGRLVVVTHERAVAAVRRLAVGRLLDLVACPDGTALTVWTQDALIAYDRPGGPLLGSAQRAGSPAPARALFDALARTGFATRDDAVPVRCGNLLTAGPVVVIGADEWRRWSEETDSASTLFARHLDAGRSPVVVGGGAGLSPGPARLVRGPDGRDWLQDSAPGIVERDSLQAIAHVDLAVTLVGPDRHGRQQAVVGDPRRAATLAGTMAPEDRCAGFDRIADELSAAGFAVTRCPLPLVAEDDPARRRRALHFLPYSNALVETTKAGPRVHMPVWENFAGVDLTAVDRDAADTFRQLGTDVVPVRGLGPLARRGGALRCALKVLERGPA
jgi:hypothetical protein